MASQPNIDTPVVSMYLPEKQSMPVTTGLRSILKRTRIRLLYAWRHRRLPDLTHPVLFTELVQMRKLKGRNKALSSLIDKVQVKKYVTQKLGRDWIIPTRWLGTCLPADPVGPYPFIVKSSHGCNQYIVVRSAQDDWQDIRRKTQKWLRRPYGQWLDEGYYADVEPGLLIEPFITDTGDLPIDYKLYVFGGQVAFIQVHLDRGTRHRWAIFDRDWHCISLENCGGIHRPATLNKMIEAAQVLAGDIDFVRIDFYEIAGKPLFGEMTFYPGSGLDPFYPKTIDAVMGDYWLKAQLEMKRI